MTIKKIENVKLMNYIDC